MRGEPDIDDSFDPSKHEMCETKYFEDFAVGDKFQNPSRTLGDANFAAFQLASGDNHPIHYDLPYCQARGHDNLLAHGYQVLIQTCPGAGTLAHVMGDAMIAFIEQSSKFLKPFYAGDTAYPTLEITDLKEQRSTGVVTLRSTVHNQRRELVMEGEVKLLCKKRD